MSYTAKAFPVRVDPKKTYDFGTKAGGVGCELTELGWRAGNRFVWWSPGTFDQQRGSGYGHNAIDVMAPLGAQVVAARPGRVLGPGEWVYSGERRDGAGWSDQGGWYVRIEADEGGVDFYSHMLKEPRVRPGERVAAGQVIGEVGQSGNASYTCPHLHYQVRDGAGRVVNPIPQLTALFEQGGWIQKPNSKLLLALGAAALVGTAGIVAWRVRG